MRELIEAGHELVGYASYAEIVGGVSYNRSAIRKWCDKFFDSWRPYDTLTYEIKPTALLDRLDELETGIAKIMEPLPKEEPVNYGFTGNSDDDRKYGEAFSEWLLYKQLAELITTKPTE